MEFTIETISPAKASKYLESSPENRVTSSTRKVANIYAEAMKRGEWRMNGECIIFDKEGRLLDGHHRLLGVTIAGIPVKLSVCRGVDREVFTTYNCGLRTNLAQILGMKGVKNNMMIMGIIGININLCSTGRIRSNNGASGGGTRTISSDFNVYMADRDAYDEAAVLANRLYSYGKILRHTWIGGVYYFLTHKGGYSPIEVLPFFEALCHLETSGVTPCDTLRNYIIRQRFSNMKLEDGYLAALLIKAWNAYITKRTVKQIRFNQEKEPYPKFILKY